MNATATKQHNAPHVSLGQSSLLFEGKVGLLDWHQHSFVCVLIGIEGTFEAQWRNHSPVQCTVLLVPPACDHRLDFGQRTMLSFYIAPHEHHFADLARAANGQPRPVPLSSAWRDALAHWHQEHDAELLRTAISNTWIPTPGPHLDARVLWLLRAFWQGQHLDASTSDLAALVRLSPSRLTHLFRQETGSALRRLRRGYRFWQAAHAMIAGATFTEAAHRSGFADSAHFSRSFRDAYGLAPSYILLPNTVWTRCTKL